MEALTPPTERWPFRFLGFLVASSIKTDSRSSLAIRQVTSIGSAGFYGGAGIEVCGINGIIEFGSFALV